MAGWSCCVRGGGKLGGEGFVHSCNSFLLIIFWRNGWRCTSVGADGVPTLLPPGCLHGKRSVNLARPEKAGREVEQISVCGPMAYERVKMRVVPLTWISFFWTTFVNVIYIYIYIRACAIIRRGRGASGVWETKFKQLNPEAARGATQEPISGNNIVTNP